MTVRLKAATLVVASFVIAFVAVHFISHGVLVPSYASLETSYVHMGTAQAVHALGVRLESLDTTNLDWASWDDTYDFVLTQSHEYIDSNLVDGTFTALGVNAIIILASSGDIVFAKAFDFENDEPSEVPDDLVAHLTGEGYLAARLVAHESTSGVLSLTDGIMLISARPVMTSDETGPPRGSFVMGAFVSEQTLQDISNTTMLSVAGTTLRESAIGLDGADAPPFAEPSEVAVTPLGPDLIEGSTVILDLYDQPVYELSITQSREIYAEGQRTLTFLLTIIAVGGVALALLFLISLDRTILSRLSRLAANVRTVGEQADFSGQVAVDGDDDIGFLAATINETLRALTHTHRQLEASHSELERSNTNLKRTEQQLGTTANQLRRLTRHLQSMHEDEQAYVAKEIRDQVGQGLTAVKMDLSSLRRAAERGDTPSTAFIERITEVIDSLLDTVRRLSTGLRPSALEDLGLADGFEWQLAEFGRERAIKTTFRIRGPASSVDASRALTLFRILQEALLISAEDPATTEVSVSLDIETAYALLSIRDNGTTLLDGAAAARREIGLSLIRERSEIFGGGIAIDSSPETGTSIVVQLPL